jgi:hypothetical protein
VDHSQHEQYRDESAWEVRQLRLELEAVRKGEEYIRPSRYTVTQKGKEGGSAIPKDKLVKDLLSSLNTLLEIKPKEEVKPKRKWVGLTDDEKHDCYLKIDVWSRCVEAVEAKLREKNGG